MSKFSSGQRWFSEGEPELGIGIIESVEDRTVTVLYPLSNESRIYNNKSAPLKRFILEPGDEITTIEGIKSVISEVQIQNEINFYLTEQGVIPEMAISPKLDLKGSLQRLLAGNFDQEAFFQTRYDSYLMQRKYQEFKHKGFLSPKVRLLPHQVYIVSEVLKMNNPRVMLCDEVGLGKTIEACLILNGLIQRELVENCLILVPESLVNQWFVELFKKFQLSFTTLITGEEDFDLETLSKAVVSTKIFKESPEMRELLLAKDWDMLIIDESHQFNYGKKEDASIQSLSEISLNTVSTLFLSATPEVLGHHNLFDQLNFLDPEKYQDFKNFEEQLENSKVISSLIQSSDFYENKTPLLNYFDEKELNKFSNKTEVKKALIDRFGTGRNYFRNSRRNLEKYSKLFNARRLNEYPIHIDGKLSDKIVIENKLSSLYELLQRIPEEKVLIICHSKAVVQKLVKGLLELQNFKIASFHSDQTLIERDRQSVYFADENGAQILISTEIGAEGRNFEFAHHLVLFDLPKLPDQLEQRIGRLDRIGQEQDINIHVPYIKNTFEEILFKWYNNVFNSFSICPLGAHEFYSNHKDDLISLIESPFDKNRLNDFIDAMKNKYIAYKKELELGRDLLIEENSYQDDIAKEIIESISSFENENSPQKYVENICEVLGIKHEELTEKSFYIAPTDNMYIPSYPGLTSEGYTVSYEREFSLKYDMTQFFSWEHPFVKNAFEFFLNGPLGNCGITKAEQLPRNIYFEFIVKLYCSDEFKHLSSIHLPFTPIRVLLNARGEDETKKYPKKFIDLNSVSIENSDLEVTGSLPKETVVNLFKKADLLASKKKSVYINKAVEKADKLYQDEMNRLKTIGDHNPHITEHISLLNHEMKLVIQSIETASCVVDSFRLILPST